MSKIRVLRAITWLPVGGIERRIVDVLPRLDRSRFEVSLVCLRERGPLADELEAAGIPVAVIRFRNRWDQRGLRQLARLMREREIDVVHSQMYRSNVPATVAARMAGKRHVWSQIHNVDSWDSRRQVAVDRWLCRWREGILAVSEGVRRDAIEKLRLPAERVRVLYNGVDLSRFAPGGDRDSLRREIGVGEDDFVFLFAARLVEQKRPQDFLELARRLLGSTAHRARGEPARFWLAGDGKLRGELEAQAASIAGHERIRFLGPRDDMPRVMAAADALVMTSTREGFSNSLLEALASGLAVIATDVGGNSEAIRSGQDGLIVPPLDPEALWVAGRSVLDDAPLCDALRKNGRERAQAFSVEAMVRNLEDLYEGSVRAR